MCSKGADFEMADFETTVRRAFARLTQDDLPRAAEARGWPVRTAEGFEKLLLDHLSDAGRRDAPSLFDLVLAVEVGEQMLAGNLCCSRMSQRLGCPDAVEARRSYAWKALVGVLEQASRDRGQP